MELNEYQRVDPGKCGSCNYFRPRDPGDGCGQCDFKLPPWVQSRPEPSESDSEVNSRTVNDSSSCTLYAPKRDDRGGLVVFTQTQKRRWSAGGPRIDPDSVLCAALGLGLSVSIGVLMFQLPGPQAAAIIPPRDGGGFFFQIR